MSWNQRGDEVEQDAVVDDLCRRYMDALKSSSRLTGLQGRTQGNTGQSDTVRHKDTVCDSTAGHQTTIGYEAHERRKLGSGGGAIPKHEFAARYKEAAQHRQSEPCPSPAGDDMKECVRETKEDATLASDFLINPEDSTRSFLQSTLKSNHSYNKYDNSCHCDKTRDCHSTVNPKLSETILTLNDLENSTAPNSQLTNSMKKQKGNTYFSSDDKLSDSSRSSSSFDIFSSPSTNVFSFPSLTNLKTPETTNRSLNSSIHTPVMSRSFSTSHINDLSFSTIPTNDLKLRHSTSPTETQGFVNSTSNPNDPSLCSSTSPTKARSALQSNSHNNNFNFPSSPTKFRSPVRSNSCDNILAYPTTPTKCSSTSRTTSHTNTPDPCHTTHDPITPSTTSSPSVKSRTPRMPGCYNLFATDLQAVEDLEKWLKQDSEDNSTNPIRTFRERHKRHMVEVRRSKRNQRNILTNFEEGLKLNQTVVDEKLTDTLNGSSKEDLKESLNRIENDLKNSLKVNLRSNIKDYLQTNIKGGLGNDMNRSLAAVVH